MVTRDPVDLNLTMSPSSPKIPALLTKNTAQPCQIESCGEIMWIRVRPIDDDHHHYSAFYHDPLTGIGTGLNGRELRYWCILHQLCNGTDCSFIVSFHSK